MCLLYTVQKKYLYRSTRLHSEEIVCKHDSRTSAMDKTCKCEKVISSAIYKIKDNLVSRPIDQVLAVLVQGCQRVDALVDFYSRGTSRRNTILIDLRMTELH